MLARNSFERKLLVSGILLILGLLVEAFCVLAPGPLYFVLFIVVGGFLCTSGILIYLLALLGHKPKPTEPVKNS